jgi:hypothetical protein
LDESSSFEFAANGFMDDAVASPPNAEPEPNSAEPRPPLAAAVPIWKISNKQEGWSS